MPRSDFVKETKLYNHCNSSPHTKISTNYMVQDFPSMVHNYSAGQGILFLLNPRDQYCVCRSPTFDPIPSQFNSVHIFHTISLRFILMLPSHLCFGVPSGLFTWGFQPNSECTLNFLHVWRGLLITKNASTLLPWTVCL